MNQACDGGLGPFPYSAVPVLPWTPGGKPTPAAVPLVTTARISGRSVLRIVGLIVTGWLVCGGAGLVTSCGGRHVPFWMAPATAAWLSGLTRSVPWPNASAAKSTVSRGVSKWHSLAGMPSLCLELKPNSCAIDASEEPDSRWVASMANVVLHDTANALSRLVVPKCSSSKLWNFRPPSVTVGGHCTVLFGRIPRLARADAVTILKVEPGGNTPSSARLKPPGRSTTARTLPVEG